MPITLDDLPTLTTRASNNQLPGFFQNSLGKIGSAISSSIDGVTDWWTTPTGPTVGVDPATGRPIYGNYGNPWGGLDPAQFPERVSPLGSLIQRILPEWAYPPGMTTGATREPVAWRNAGGVFNTEIAGGVTVGNALLIAGVAALGFLAYKKLT